jgi:hypothetical protein
MKKVKNILIKLELDGVGVVNMDSNAQKWVLKKTRLSNFNDNVSFAKKVFVENNNPDDETDVDFKLKISDDCILKNAFRYDHIAPTPNIIHHPALLYANIASPVSILKGYLFPSAKETLKRKGSLKLTSAIQSCNAKSILETFSRSGAKVSNDGSDDKKDTTFFSKETVGEIKYAASGNIDLMSLQFLPCDAIFDRYQLNPDYFKLYKEFLQKKMPDFNGELGYFQLKNSSIEIPEYGVMLSEENVVFLVKEALKRLLGVNIVRKGAYANVTSLKIKLVNDPLTDTLYNDNNWIQIANQQDIDNLNFEVHKYYELVNIEDAKKFREDFEAKIVAEKEMIKEMKKEKAATKKKNKEANNNDNG